jgi:hypothetical protein
MHYRGAAAVPRGRGLDDYETMRMDPGPLPYRQEALTIAKFEPGIDDVVESFAPPRDAV